ncbi:MAG: hypothetical protein KatS3mg123_0247 [Burkholderiales bacterium]|nr:MAG: hypothetical protein KatS3mg123_0247 [Burkholderiales bacterium]
MSNPDFDSPELQYEVLFERQVRARTEELSAALEKLSEESMRFRQLAEYIQGVFYLTDPDNREMLYVSPAYEAIWGRSRESLYANPRSWADAILPEDRERVRAALEKESITGSFDEEYRISRPDGIIRWIRARSFPRFGTRQARSIASRASPRTSPRCTRPRRSFA